MWDVPDQLVLQLLCVSFDGPQDGRQPSWCGDVSCCQVCTNSCPIFGLQHSRVREGLADPMRHELAGCSAPGLQLQVIFSPVLPCTCFTNPLRWCQRGRFSTCFVLQGVKQPVDWLVNVGDEANADPTPRRSLLRSAWPGSLALGFKRQPSKPGKRKVLMKPYKPSARTWAAKFRMLHHPQPCTRPSSQVLRGPSMPGPQLIAEALGANHFLLYHTARRHKDNVKQAQVPQKIASRSLPPLLCTF